MINDQGLVSNVINGPNKELDSVPGFKWNVVNFDNKDISHLWNQEDPEKYVNSIMKESGSTSHIAKLDKMGGKVRIHCSWNSEGIKNTSVSQEVKVKYSLAVSFCETLCESPRGEVIAIT